MVKCWGGNWVGQLGIGSEVQYGDGAGDMGASTPAHRQSDFALPRTCCQDARD